MLADLGFNALRLSISWPRIFPLGADGQHAPNPKGVQFYKNVLAKLKDKGVTPMVTIFHWDLPNDLDWLSDTVVDEYVKYVEFLFETFPDIKHWATFNEPLSFCPAGYNGGFWPPSIKSDYLHLVCGHNVLRSHARAVKLYRQKYQQQQGGKIGIVIDYKWAYPMNASSKEDQVASQLHHDFHMGWWADPIFLSGDYPVSMRTFYGDRLPRFAAAEMNSLRFSADFYGVNTYGAKYVKFDPLGVNGQFKEINPCQDWSPPPAGECAESPWLWIHPPAMRLYLEYVYNRYNIPDIYVTEFGMDVKNETKMPLDEALHDKMRVEFYRNYLDEAATAKRDGGVPVKGAFAWSLLDNLEWKDGYKCRFGITYVNFTTQERFPKDSAKWFQTLIKNDTKLKLIV